MRLDVLAAISGASVAHIESTLTTIEQLLLFAIPLLTVVGTAYIGLYLHLRAKLGENNAQLRQIARQTNGNLEQLAGSVEQLAANTARAPRRATDPEPVAGPATIGGGGEPSPVPPAHGDQLVQPPPGDGQPLSAPGSQPQ